MTMKCRTATSPWVARARPGVVTFARIRPLPAWSSRREPQNFDLSSFGYGIRRRRENTMRDVFRKIVFPTVIADVGGYPLQDHGGIAPLKRHRDVSCTRLTGSADSTDHYCLLVRKSGCQRFGS